MKFTKEFLTRALNNDRQAGALLQPVIRKCALAGTKRAGAAFHVDDIEQELWIFLRGNLSRLDERYNIEPWLIMTARNMALAYNRKFSVFGTDGEDHRVDGLAGLEGQEIAGPHEFNSALVTAVDQRNALRYLMEQSAELSEAAKTQGDDMIRRDKPRNKLTANRLSDEQRELRKLRGQAGLSQPDMASLLGLKLSTLQSYEYGRTKGVPAEVIEDARKIANRSDYRQQEALYTGRSIIDVATGWMHRLDIPSGAFSQLAEVLAVDRSTVSRWFDENNETRQEPHVRQVAEYEELVTAAEARLGQAHSESA